MTRLTEIPREAIQASPGVIPPVKILSYLNHLLPLGFDVIETGSLVSSRVLPQMADSLNIIDQLDPKPGLTRLMILLVNKKGADLAAPREKIGLLSFPFSISGVFQQKNLGATMDEALETLDYIINTCIKTGKEFVPYLSMAFGNPYGDAWNLDILSAWVARMHSRGIRYLPLSNVAVDIGPDTITTVFSRLRSEYPDMTFGLHLHTGREFAYQKIHAAYQAGCRCFDMVMNGEGGCPMASRKLLPNLATEDFMDYLAKNQLQSAVDPEKLALVSGLALDLFGGGPHS